MPRLALFGGAGALGLAACVGYLDENYGAASDREVEPARIDAAAEAGAAFDASADGPTPCGPDAYACQVLADKPLVYLRFEETGATQLVRDEASGCSGTYAADNTSFGIPGALASSPSARAVRLLGGTYGIAMNACGRVEAESPQFSVELWLNVTPAMRNKTVDFLVWPGKGAGFIFQLASGLLKMTPSKGLTLLGSADSKVALGFDAWHHCVFTYDGLTGDASMWIDGVVTFDAALTSGGFLAAATSGWWFSGGYEGALDEVAIYDRRLTQAEVTAHFDKAR